MPPRFSLNTHLTLGVNAPLVMLVAHFHGQLGEGRGPRTRAYKIGNQGGTMVNSVVIYWQLSHNRFPMDGALVGCGRVT
jgi:hypothetical protein